MIQTLHSTKVIARPGLNRVMHDVVNTARDFKIGKLVMMEGLITTVHQEVQVISSFKLIETRGPARQKVWGSIAAILGSWFLSSLGIGLTEWANSGRKLLLLRDLTQG